jgi:hypothetical protein
MKLTSTSPHREKAHHTYSREEHNRADGSQSCGIVAEDAYTGCNAIQCTLVVAAVNEVLWPNFRDGKTVLGADQYSTLPEPINLPWFHIMLLKCLFFIHVSTLN